MLGRAVRARALDPPGRARIGAAAARPVVPPPLPAATVGCLAVAPHPRWRERRRSSPAPRAGSAPRRRGRCARRVRVSPSAPAGSSGSRATSRTSSTSPIPESCERFVTAAVEALGGLDILVNNAGGALGRYPVLGVQRGGRGVDARGERPRPDADDAPLPAAHPRRRAHRQHRLDRGPRRRTRTPPSYCAVKAAAAMFSQALREDLLGRPIRVTAVGPGLTEHELLARSLQG